ncbi:MAG: ATP-binding protein [Sedimenticola sp.]
MARASFRRRLVFTFVGLAAVPLLAAAVVVAWYSFQQSMAESLAHQRELAQRVRVQVESLFQHVESIINTSLSVSSFERLDRVGRQKVLGEILSQRFLFREAAFIGADGEYAQRLSNVRMTSDEMHLSEAERLVFMEAVSSSDPFYGPVYFDERDSEPLIMVGMPISESGSGRPQGVVSVELRFKAVWDLLSEMDIEGGQAVYITDTHGRLVAHPNPALVLRKSTLPVSRELRRAGLEEADVLMIMEQLLLGNREFLVIVEKPVQVAIDRAFDQLRHLSMIAVASIVMAIMLFLIISRRLLRPVAAISDAAKAIREGDWQSKVDVDHQDELGEMAAAFNSMIQRLTDTLKKLEEENHQRAQAEEGLARANERLETLTQFESGWIYWRNEEKDRFHYISPTCESFTGYTVEEFLQDPGLLDSIIHPDDRARWDGHAHKMDSAGSLVPEEFRIIRKSGEVRWISHTCRPVINDNGERDGRRGSNQDVTERKRMQELMVQTEKMMSVGGLAAGMAHELNNPLAGILQGIQNIRRRLSVDIEKNVEVARKVDLELEKVQAYFDERGITGFLNGIAQSGERSAKIVENMLQFARKPEAALLPENLQQLVDDTLGFAAVDYDLKKNYDFRKINVEREYDASVGSLPCIKSEIQQVLLNLFRNAAQGFQQMDASKTEPTIRVRVRAEGKHACIDVEDNGPGMDEAVRSRVFEPFFTTRPTGEGTGLGLSVSYFIVTQEHKGEITVESKPGSGAKFTVRLPR